jgi:hypothetical protein
MNWLLVLHFACGYAYGGYENCAQPRSVTLTERYQTWQACQQAGAVWLSPAANAQGTVAHISCQRIYASPTGAAGTTRY